MNTGKRLIASVLAVLLMLQGLGTVDSSQIGIQKAYADTIKQPVPKANIRSEAPKGKQTASATDSTPKSKDSVNIKKLSGSSRTEAANTNKKPPISYSNYLESDPSLQYTQQKTPDKQGDLAALSAKGFTETADSIPADIQEALTPAAISIPSNINI